MSNFAEHSDIIEIITRYLSNEADNEEILFLENWRKENPDNESLFEEYNNLWNKTDQANEIRKINLEQEWQKFDAEIEKISKKQNKTFSFRPILRIAASIVIIASLTFFGWFLTQQLGGQKYIAQNEVKTIELPDGSKVTLNHESKLRYSKDFGEENREVVLEGEAYFEVAKDSTKPFVIGAANSVVEVLGTSFNVNAYKENSEVEVVVNSGIVAFSSKNMPDEKIILKAGEKGELLKNTQKLNLQKNEDVNFLSWKTKKLTFENENLSDVVKTLEKVYHKQFRIESESIRGCSITTTFDNQNLKSVMLIIESTLDVTFKQDNGIISITGPGC